MSNSLDYVLKTGADAEFRLEVLQRVHGPDTRRFLDRAGLQPGMRVADFGCGHGQISRWIAEIVGPQGHVMGIDAGAGQIDVAERITRESGLRNIRYHLADAAKTGLDGEQFDVVYCRFLLMHLPDDGGLREMYRVLKPGGLLLIEDGDFESPFCWPPNPAFDRCFELYRATVIARGADPLIGRRLFEFVQNLPVKVLSVDLAQRAFTSGDEMRLPEWTLAECADSIIKDGLASRAEVEETVAEMAAMVNRGNCLVGCARVMQVLARKLDAI